MNFATNILANELHQVREARNIARKKKRRPSKLDRYRAEILTLREQGASFEDIRLWLRKKRIRANKSTIIRAVKRWEPSSNG